MLDPALQKQPNEGRAKILSKGEFPGCGLRIPTFIKPNVNKEFLTRETIKWKQNCLRTLKTPYYTKGSNSLLTKSMNCSHDVLAI